MTENTVKISDLATKTELLLTDLLAIADSNGVAYKGSLGKLQTFLNTIGVSGYKGIVTPNVGGIPQMDGANITENGVYIVSADGDYGTITGITIANNFVLLDVKDIDTTVVYSKADIPLNIGFDSTPTAGSTNAVTSEGIKSYADNLKPTIWANVNDFNTLKNSKLPVFPYNYNELTSLGTTSQFLESGVLVFKNETNLSLKLTNGYDLTNDNGRVLEVFFTAKTVASGNGFGLSYTRAGNEYNLIYRQNGQLTEYINNTNTNGLVIRTTNATYQYSDNDVLSIKLRIDNNIATYTTSLNGVYSDEIFKPNASFTSFSYAFKGVCEVSNPYFISFLDEEVLDTLFVNDATGLDTNTGKFPYTQPSGGSRSPENGPLKTITEALKRKPKSIFVIGGTYSNETDLSLDYDVDIKSYKGQEVSIDLSEKHLGNTFTVNGTYSNVYQKNIAETVTTAFEDDYTKWLELVGSLLECSTTEGSCYYSSGVLYINPVNSVINNITVIIPSKNGFEVPTPAIDGLGTFTRVTSNVNISGITTLYAVNHGYALYNVNFNLFQCNAYGSKNNGFYFVDSFGTAKGCNGSFNDGDGFNIHAFDDERGSYVDLIDCVGNDNYGIGQGNDGVSYHELCKGRIIGGEYLRNTKYDIIHVQIAQVQHYNLKCGTLYNDMTGNISDVIDLQVMNVIADDITVKSNNPLVNIEISNCKSDKITIDGAGTINANLYKNKTLLLELKSAGTNKITDNKLKGGYGIDMRSSVSNFDGNSILNSNFGFIKTGGTATMGSNNLYGNTQDYAGSDPVTAPEQAKNVSYLEI